MGQRRHGNATTMYGVRASNTAIAGLARGAEQGVRDQSENRCKVAEATECRRSENRSLIFSLFTVPESHPITHINWA
jgi:hypothetical protein